jgi:ATP-dependent Clp protease ATP-binding subunit ClpC
VTPGGVACHAVVMFERFTERARRTLVLAQDEARQLGHGAIGPEHLLLGLARGGDALGEALAAAGLGADALREAVGPGEEPEGPERGSRPFSPSARRALEMALKRAHELGDEDVGKVHLLMGIGDLADDEGVPVLDQLEVTGESLREIALDARGGPEVELQAPGERPSGSRERARAGDEADVPAETPYCPWCDSPFRARWWWQKAAGAEGKPGLAVVVIGCSTCGTVTSVVAPPSAG